MNVDYKLIGRRIQQTRKSQGLTQEKIAEQLDVSVGYISQIERGITKVSLDTLARLSTALNENIATFIDNANKTVDFSYMYQDTLVLMEQLSPKEQDTLKAMLEVYVKGK